jgi:hypothetical protein
MTSHNERTMCLRNQLYGLSNLLLVEMRHTAPNGLDTARRCLINLGRVLGFFDLHILGDIDQDRARSSALCDTKRLMYCRRYIAGVLNEKRVLRDRLRYPNDIDLLESIATESI